jgi:tetratricopeptide (TPR) repeat protein
MKEEVKLEKENKIILEFQDKNGKDFSKLVQKSYQFFNGEEYCNYIREGYKISQQIYGDSPMNLDWRPRNNIMYKNIEKAISENKEKNIIILTGGEHKYYFDDTLRTRKDIKLVTIKDLLPHTKASNNSAVINYIENGEDSLYFLPDYPKNSDQYFSNKLVPLVHGMQMDEKPEIIPEKNKNQAKIILSSWSKKSPQSIKFLFEQGWYYFLIKDYSQAINLFEKLDNTLDSMNIKKQTNGIENYWFINTMINRTMGLCYDLTGMREKAIVQYNKGIEKIDNDTEMPKMKKIIFKKYLYSNYLKEPYKGW